MILHVSSTYKLRPNSEIERLKHRVRELEQQLKEERNTAGPSKSNAPVPEPSHLVSATSSLSIDLNHVRDTTSNKKFWGGVYTSTAQSRQKAWYGPSSLFYFISRMNTYLATVFEQLHLEEHVQLDSVAKSLPTPDYDDPLDIRDPSSQEPSKTAASREFLTPIQEEYFLDLFWQSYHSSLVVLNEVEFKAHWRSLFVTPGKPRAPSALVDMVIAISMQYGSR